MTERNMSGRGKVNQVFKVFQMDYNVYIIC